MPFTKREVKSKKLTLSFTIELYQSSLTPDEAAERIRSAINSYNSKGFSNFIVDLLRDTRSSTYELKEMTIE